MIESILIADDEALIRKGFMARLAYLNINPHTIYQASNGMEAFEIIRNKRPQAVFTDIKMPEMDGLTLIAQTKDIFPEIEFVILSGYAEFSYVEQGVKMGINAYLLKPLVNDELLAVFEKLEKNFLLKQMISRVDLIRRDNRKFILEKEIYTILSENYVDGNRLQNFIENTFTKTNTAMYFLTAIMNIEPVTYEDRDFGIHDADLIKFALKNVFYEMDSECERVIVDNPNDMNKLTALFYGEKKSLVQEARVFLTKLIDNMRKNMKIKITAGVSSLSKTIGLQFYKEASEAIMHKIMNEGEKLFFFESKMLAPADLPNKELHLLEKYMKRGDIYNIEMMLQDILSKQRLQNANFNYIRFLWLRIINMIVILLEKDNKIGIKGLEKLKPEAIEKFSSLNELINFIYSSIIHNITFDDILDLNAQNKIKHAVKYIEDNYNKDLSVNELTAEYCMSPNYFSTLFKKETGMNFVNYITNLRINESCRLLRETQLSTIKIAEIVGYEDSRYFFRVFKKEVGFTPLHYRKNTAIGANKH